MFSLYLHIPYCLKKCRYCNFNSVAQCVVPEEEYCAALLAELKAHAETPLWRGRAIRTIYFGGGTPSIFSGAAIYHLMQEVAKVFDTSKVEEITLEANPATLTTEKLQYYKAFNLNRLSLGVQSLNQETLATLGRVHTVSETLEALALCKENGIDNLSLDLIYGVPRQSVPDLKRDIAALTTLQPKHISAYCLSIEEGTPLFEMVKSGELKPLQEEIVAEMMVCVMTDLEEKGYQHYEISNFAVQGYHSKHNSAYWDGSDYLGLGAGAHSFNAAVKPFGRRWSNLSFPEKYLAAAHDLTKVQDFSETLTERDALNEFFMLGLRRKVGFSVTTFEERFKRSFSTLYGATTEALFLKGLLEKKDNNIKLTKEGVLLADEVIESFIRT